MVFLEYKKHAHRMMILFGLAGIKAAELHGDLLQEERLHSLQQFRDGSVDILLCTDVASRGIDIEGVHAVINYEMPKDISSYVHRVGRTARAGRQGRAVTLTSESRRLITKQVARHCRGVVKSRAIPPAVIDQWSAQIVALEGEIKQVMNDEFVEIKIRKVEKEMNRAQNLVTHKDEIMARPARTWFQSQHEKEERKQSDKEIMESEMKKTAALSRKKNTETSTEFMAGDNDEPEKMANATMLTQARKSKKEVLREKKDRNNESISEMQNRKDLARKKRKSLSSFDMDLATEHRKKELNVVKVRTPAKEFVFKEKITELRRGGKQAGNSFKSKKRYKR